MYCRLPVATVDSSKQNSVLLHVVEGVVLIGSGGVRCYVINVVYVSVGIMVPMDSARVDVHYE